MTKRKTEEPGPHERETLLRTISGGRLTSVQFVLDYLILGFDERGALTTLVWPEVHHGAAIVKFGANGYRDRLCELIGQSVKTAEITDDETILIAFQNLTLLRIALRERLAAGERAILNAHKHHRLAVW